MHSIYTHYCMHIYTHTTTILPRPLGGYPLLGGWLPPTGGYITPYRGAYLPPTGGYLHPLPGGMFTPSPMGMFVRTTSIFVYAPYYRVYLLLLLSIPAC